MKPLLPALFLGLGLSTAPVTPAAAYPVDCAILLCLAGGWPASAECAHARAVFIRRITPWPIEPPLQIWRCPIGVSFDAGEMPSPMERFYDITFRRHPSRAPKGWISTPTLARAGEQADVDISGDAFDFVRSIRVYHIQYSQRENRDGDCNRSDATRLASYGEQGAFRWTRSSVFQVPPDAGVDLTGGCQSYSYRSVFVDWRDHTGAYGSEEVPY